MSISRWEPFGELMSLREAMDRLFEDSLVKPSRFFPQSWGEGLAVDVYQTENDVVVKASLPGVKREEVEITVSGDTLTIKGEHQKRPTLPSARSGLRSGEPTVHPSSMTTGELNKKVSPKLESFRSRGGAIIEQRIPILHPEAKNT